MKLTDLSKYFLTIFLIALALILILVIFASGKYLAPLVVTGFVSLALFCMGHAFLKSFAFTVWVFAFVAVSLFYPSVFGSLFGLDLGILIVPLIQIIMFGMGTTLNLNDFKRVLVMPLPVFVGFVLQFTIMPLSGFALAGLFGFEPEVAAGVILNGSCPGGVASNLMTYLAGGNVALSVTMTSCSTLVSPLMTPFLMKSLAGKLVPIDFIAMMLSILNMIIVPIIAGLLANRILYGRQRSFQRSGPLVLLSVSAFILAAVTILIPAENFGTMAAVRSGLILGFTLIGVVALAKWLVQIFFNGPADWMDKTLPVVSMVGICYIIAIITSRSGEKLMSVGLWLITASIVHNFTGYILGYWISRAVRLNETTSRTVAFEVGMQNSGMASGLAMSVLKSAHAALAPAIFGPWMNISGSVLATWWHRK